MGNSLTYWPRETLRSFLQAALEFHQAVWRADGEVRKPSINQGQLGDTLARLRTRMLFSASLFQGSWGRSLAPTVALCALINGFRVGQWVDSHPLIWVSSGHVCRWWWTPDWAVFPSFSHILNWAIRSCTGGKACANGSELCLVFLGMFACRGMLTFKWHYLKFMVRCRKCILNL